MNSQANAMNGSPLDATRTAPSVLVATRPFYWSLRRELWENWWLYLAPLAAAAVFLIGFMVTAGRIPAQMREMAGPIAQRHRIDAIALPYDMAAGLLMVTAMIVAAYYSLSALQGERRDRSILFWKSMPVSDRTVVLTKAVIPIFLVQLFTFAVTVVLQFLMLLVNSAVLAGSGQSVAQLWTVMAPLQVWRMLFYHLMVVHALWHAPFYGWMLLVSSWARRAAFLWAALPVVAIMALEKLLFRTTHFVDFLRYRLAGDPTAVFVRDLPTDPMTQLAPLHFLFSVGLWEGLIFTALCVWGAVLLRRQHGPL
jgi:ABC-2 type transport system permease protein